MTSSAASIFVSFSSLRNMHKHMHAEAQHTQALVPWHQHKESAGSTDGWAGLGPSSQGKNIRRPGSIRPSSVHRAPASSHASRLRPGRMCQPVRGRLRHRVWSPQQAGALTLRHDPRLMAASKAICLRGIQWPACAGPRLSLLFSRADQMLQQPDRLCRLLSFSFFLVPSFCVAHSSPAVPF